MHESRAENLLTKLSTFYRQRVADTRLLFYKVAGSLLLVGDYMKPQIPTLSLHKLAALKKIA